MGLLDVVKYLQRIKGNETVKVKKEQAEIQIKEKIRAQARTLMVP